MSAFARNISYLITTLALAACMPTPAPIISRACLSPSEPLSDAQLVERAKIAAREAEETPRDAADCCRVTWIDTSVDETRGEWLEYSAQRHRSAREAGLTEYAVVSVRVRDVLGAEQDRSFWFDRCGEGFR